MTKRKLTQEDLEQIDNLLARAAHTAAPVFEQMRWEWAWRNSNKRVPTEAELAIRLAHLFDRLLEGDFDNLSTGRFAVSWNDDQDSADIGLNVSLDLGTVYCLRPEEEE
jgi:hypothetical protein